MNKYLLLALFALSGCIKLFAQEYKYVPLVRKGMEWCYYAHGWSRTEPYGHYFLYRIEGDTLIVGATYNKCNSYNRSKDGKLVREGYFREENKKVYFLNEENKNYGKDGECLLYDFSPTQAGDTLFWDTTYDYGWIVSKIDTLTIDGTLRKRFWIGETPTKYAYEGFAAYAEGIGETGDYGLGESVGGPLLAPFIPLTTCMECVSYEIVYVKRSNDGVIELLNENIYNQFLTSSMESVSTSALQIDQEPGRWVVTLPPNEEYSKVEVLDAAGRIVHCENIADKAETLMISTNKFAQGIYIVVLTAQSRKLTTCKMQVQ